jgi:TolA-binding protein
MNDDIETIRRGQSNQRDFYEALDRLEAEVKRLGEWKACRQAGQESIDISLLRAEVERLQEELAGWMNEDTHEVHALRGKVERLQEDRDDLIRSAKAKQERLRESEAEVERLRKKADWGDRQIEVVQELESEIARLRLIKEAAREVVADLDGAEGRLVIHGLSALRNALAKREEK